jgi:SAM-dependent methyltransferase
MVVVSQKTGDVRSSYDAVADEYVRRIYHELADKPLDRGLLDRFSSEMRGQGAVCDIGCGPGHVTRYLHDRGVRVCGLDLSLNMLTHARRLNPAIGFIQGNVLKLGVADGAWAGMTAFYLICNLPLADHPAAFAEIRRVLRPGGLLFLSFHIGNETKHLEEWWGLPVSVDFHFFQTADVCTDLEVAGFRIVDVIERDPYPDVEHQSRRAYIVCRS